MAFAVTNGTLVKATIVCSNNGQVAQNQFTFLASDVVGTPDGTDVSVALNSLWEVDVPPFMTVQASYRGLQVRKLFPVSIPAPATVSLPNVVEGLSDEPPMPTQTCGLIRWLTDFRATGRTYAPFPSVAFADTQASPLVAYLNFLDTFATHTRAPIIVTGATGSCTLQLGINSLLNGFLPVTGHASLDGWATQVRRSQFRHGDRMPF